MPNEKFRTLIQYGITSRMRSQFRETTETFKSYLESGIITRERVLFPDDPLLEISQSIQDQEVTRKEQALLKNVLAKFTLMFVEET